MQSYKEKNMSETWPPVISGNYPKERENVQVTYLGCVDGEYHCDAFAYCENNQWFWINEEEAVTVQIVAWKRNCKAYDPEEKLKRLFRNAVISQQDELEFYSGILSMGYTVDMVRNLIGAETAEHMYIFCVNHGLLKDHSAAYLYDAVCKLLKANEENLESTGFDYEKDSLDSYAAQDHTQSEILTYVTRKMTDMLLAKEEKVVL
jgi:hypothetical protein